jgi:hypothetical protein
VDYVPAKNYASRIYLQLIHVTERKDIPLLSLQARSMWGKVIIRDKSKDMVGTLADGVIVLAVQLECYVT